MAQLVEINGSSTPRAFPITTGRFVLGRGEECDLSDVFVESKGVSRQHAVILRVEGQYYLVDLQSRNGTIINGQKATARQLLKDGDRIVIANKVFRFQHDQTATRTPPTS